jgi:hypothetical protein
METNSEPKDVTEMNNNVTIYSNPVKYHELINNNVTFQIKLCLPFLYLNRYDDIY